MSGPASRHATTFVLCSLHGRWRDRWEAVRHPVLRGFRQPDAPSGRAGFRVNPELLLFRVSARADARPLAQPSLTGLNRSRRRIGPLRSSGLFPVTPVIFRAKRRVANSDEVEITVAQQ